jgi:hypothetical protein
MKKIIRTVVTTRQKFLHRAYPVIKTLDCGHTITLASSSADKGRTRHVCPECSNYTEGFSSSSS